MAKFCSNCGKELNENAALCLNCGVLVDNSSQSNNKSKKNKKGLPTWAIVLIVIVCTVVLPLLAVAGIAVMAFSEFDIFGETVYQNGTIGDTLSTDTYRITLKDALIYNSIGDEEDYLDVPEKDKEYLVFFFIIENISNEGEYISSYDFNGYVDGYAISTAYLYNNVDGYEELSADLAPGTKAKGFIAYEVDTNWQEFDMHFNDWLGETELVFGVVNENSSNTTGA